MNKYIIFSLSLFLISILAFSSYQGIKPERQWSQYRGHLSSGVLDKTNLPESWNLEKKENILWNTALPGLSLSSPIIWGEKLFVTTAIGKADKEGLKAGIYGDIGSVADDSEHEWKLYCLNKQTGEIIWEKISYRGIPKQKRHPKSSHANCSAATDGNYVVAFFGSEGLYCYDMDGNLMWEKDFGILRSVFFRAESAEWEFASSPIIYNGKVIIQCDVMENSFLAAYDVKTGKELWKQAREEYPGWCTPNIYKTDGKVRIAVNGYKHRGGYDFEMGEEIWRMSGGGDIPIPTPVMGHDLIYFNSAHGPQSPILAVNKNAKGDITLNKDQTSNSHVKWSIARGGSYMQSLLLYEGYIYNLGWNGRLSCYRADNGEKVYAEKLGRATSFTASPVASNGRIYTVSEKGEIYIVKSGEAFEILSVHELDAVCMVSPAITDNIIFFRTQSNLIAISKTDNCN